MNALHQTLIGAMALGTLAIGLFFLRFWREGGDRFFLFFALSFFVQTINRVSLALTDGLVEGSPLHYVVRLIAYLLILFAIFEKNRRLTHKPSP